jgi:hypothetical protein
VRQPNTLEDVWKSIIIKDEDKCWLWQGAPSARYGQIKVNGSLVGVHVAAYLTRTGPIPAGMQVQHSCNVKKCCNPRHLSLGNESKNAVDAIKSGLTWGPSARTTGIKGVHPLSRIPGYWNARADKINGRSLCLYSGRDFFEACCARKSWEARP